MPVDSADYRRIALLTGCATIDDVVRWADEEIARRELPESELIAISLGKSRPIDQINQLLRALVLDMNDSSALKAVLFQMATTVRDGRLPVDVAIDRIYSYARSNCPTGELRYQFISLAEDLSCIRDGVFWTDDVTVLRESLLESIANFCKRNDNQYARNRVRVVIADDPPHTT